MVGMVIAALKATFNADSLARVVLLVGGPPRGLVGLIPLQRTAISKSHNSGCCWWESVPGVREMFGPAVAMDSELAAVFHRPSAGAALNNQHLHSHA